MFFNKEDNSIWKHVTIIVTIMLIGVLIFQYIENQKLREQVNEYEEEQWYRLLRMTEYVENFQIDSGFDDKHGNHIYANQICHGFSVNYKLSRLLRETYDPLHLELSVLEDGPAKDAGLELLDEMNTYIMNISRISRNALIEGELYEPENLGDMKFYFKEEVEKFFSVYD